MKSVKCLIYVLLIMIHLEQLHFIDIKKTLMNPFKKNKLDVLKDLKKCRVTHSGVEYEGNIAQTKSGILCQNWEILDPIHKVADQIIDVDFPEGSRKKAKNFCRNPQHWSGRPWCYTLDFNVVTEECDVPLCIKKECRITGTGVEYGGLTHSSGSVECLSWTDIRGNTYKELLYDSLFPDGTRKQAENRCRNPDSDIGGPWCFINSEAKRGKSGLSYEKLYCGVPLCEPKDCMMVTAETSSGYKDYHTVFSLLPMNTTTINFSVKLWNPEQWHSGELRLALSVFSLPATGRQLRSWKAGIEIIISTYKSGLTPGNDSEPDWNIEPGLLSGVQWRDLELSWTGGFISLKIKGKAMSVFNKDYTGHEHDLSRGQFQFYSIKGSNAIWNVPFCSSDYAYEEHVTTHGDFDRRWPFPKNPAGLELKFFVKGFHTAILEMKAAAMLQYPSIQLILLNRKTENSTILTIKESTEEERTTLEEVKIESLLTFWEWREFQINVDGPRFELYWIKDSRPNKILSAIHPKIEFIKWFSIGSRQSTVQWTLDRTPPLDKLKVPGELPECVMTEGEADFSGFQSVSATGLSCIPWTETFNFVSKKLDDSNFVDGSKEDAKNYCRNPTGSVQGPYCYTVDLSNTGYAVTKQNCYPRQCRSKECKMAGTGNDYIGSLSVTVSGRACQRWAAKTPHTIPSNLLNKEMFPELSLSNVSNFCRNPSHDAAGPWCYTNDPTIDMDICNVPDCDVLGSCIIFVKGNITRQNIYILPVWKSNGLAFKVKSWDPKWTEGIRFIIRGAENDTFYRLDLGSANNDKVALFYTINGKERLLKQKTVARVIPSGHWNGFVLVLRFGEIAIKYENVPVPFFEWKYIYSEGVEPMYPKLLSYSAVSSRYFIGLSFLCEECQTHIHQPGLLENIYPFNWWSPETLLQTNSTVLSLNIRGVGTFILALIRLVEIVTNRILIEVSDYGQISVKNQSSTLAEVHKDNYKLFNNNSWTNFTLLLTEKQLNISFGEVPVIDYVSSEPLIFYFFSVSVSDGLLTWNVNCDPPNIDAPPINGAWSQWGPWECSVTCGGGHGKRKRLCNLPKPNLFGEPCNGSDIMEGVCNEFKCGDVPPELYKTMAAHSTIKAHNIRKNVGESLSVQCDQYILMELKDKSPATRVEWTKDGVPLYPQQRVGNVTVDQFRVERAQAGLNDSGIYMCALEERKGQKAVIQLTAVTVVSDKPTRVAREDSILVLDCHTALLSHLFAELTQFWLLDGHLYRDYGATTHSLLDVDLLAPLRREHQGQWECVVVQVEHNLTWVTAWFRLEVKANKVFSVMLDNVFIGIHFRPFGDDVALNTFVALILVIVIVLMCTGCFFTIYTFWQPKYIGNFLMRYINVKTPKFKKVGDKNYKKFSIAPEE